MQQRLAHSAIHNSLTLKKKPSAPGKLLFDALDESELDSRIAEGLPWLARIFTPGYQGRHSCFSSYQASSAFQYQYELDWT
jgi:hypothetical protein